MDFKKLPRDFTSKILTPKFFSFVLLSNELLIKYRLESKDVLTVSTGIILVISVSSKIELFTVNNLLSCSEGIKAINSRA